MIWTSLLSHIFHACVTLRERTRELKWWALSHEFVCARGHGQGQGQGNEREEWALSIMIHSTRATGNAPIENDCDLLIAKIERDCYLSRTIVLGRAVRDSLVTIACLYSKCSARTKLVAQDDHSAPTTRVIG